MRKRIIVALILSVIVLAVGTVGCNNKPSSNEGTSELLRVSMFAEKSQYPSNVSEINVVWKNDTDEILTFGNPFTIQKLVGNEWKAIGNKGAAFTTIGYRVAPHSEMKHSYNIRLYSDHKLEKGTYRIITDFLNVLSSGNYNNYQLTANFTVK
ncbi:immunoglobulin-like domain-containing protein [Desulfosporosinus sp. FKB]|uniref:immunoglobulin-like domain-containing protein n=1 Tax=Desulfosporosinus sp. FKB TaxID=1969835 RepID=UPI000B49C887|nr:immunoglobulin-like domain-containing protein [Desulfosporosinus sp. FKB]